jgi:hypothetical protein
MNLEIVRRIRLMAVVALLFGLFSKTPLISNLALVVWLYTFLYSIRVIEDKLFDKHDDENKDKTDENQQ